jgi:hypothetical protein
MGPNWEELHMTLYDERIPLSPTRRRMESAEEVQAFLKNISVMIEERIH